MSKYHVAEAVGHWFVIMDTDDNQHDVHAYFNGYDEMGSVNWEKRFSFDYALSSREEAEQIIKDLESADEPAEPVIPEKHIYEVYAKRWSSAEKKQIMFLVGEFKTYFHASLFSKAYNEYFQATTKIVEYKAV